MERQTGKKVNIFNLLYTAFVSLRLGGWLAAALLILMPAAQAQSLDSLIDIGISRSHKIQSLEHKKDAVRAKAASLAAFPPASAGILIEDIPFNSMNLLNDSRSNTLTLSQMIPLGGKLEAMSAAELKNLAVIEQELRQEKFQLAAQIKKLYSETRISYTEVDVLQKTRSLYELLLDGLLAGYQSGGSGTPEILMLKGNIAALDAEILNAQVCCTAGLQQLQKLIQFEHRPKISAEQLPILRNELSFDSLAAVLRRTPKLQAMNAMQEMQQAEIGANDKELIPDLMLEAMLMRMPLGMPVISPDDPMMIVNNRKTEYMYSIGASVTLPFLPWSRGGVEKRSEQMASGIRQLGAEREDMIVTMSANLRGMLTRYESMQNILSSYESSVLPALEGAASAALEQYRAGRLSMPQFIEYRKMYLMEQMKYVMALKDIYAMHADIEIMTNTIED